MKEVLYGVGLALAGLLIVAVLVLMPDFNEARLYDELQPAFGRFGSVTSKRYPDAAEREAQRAAILAERERLTKEHTWPLMNCSSAFIMHNPNTWRRRDALQVRCSWRWFAH